MVKLNFTCKNLLKAIVVSICCVGMVTVYASGDKKLFYNNPTSETLLGKIKEAKDINSPHIRKLINISVTFALKEHPELSKGLTGSLDNLPRQLRPLVVQGVVNVQGKDIEENKEYNFTPQPLVKEINEFKFTYPSDDSEQEEHNLKGADYLWAAFYATGNKDYIIRTITFLNKFPLKIRTIAAEVENREALQAGIKYLTEKEETGVTYKDLVTNLNEKEKHQFTTYKIISWSLKSNRHQYPAIDSIVKEIFNSNSDLDFYKDIKL